MTTLIVRFNEDTGAIEEHHEPVREVLHVIERNHQVNSGLTPSVRRQDDKNRRVNGTVSLVHHATMNHVTLLHTKPHTYGQS